MLREMVLECLTSMCVRHIKESVRQLSPEQVVDLVFFTPKDEWQAFLNKEIALYYKGLLADILSGVVTPEMVLELKMTAAPAECCGQVECQNQN